MILVIIIIIMKTKYTYDKEYKFYCNNFIIKIMFSDPKSFRFEMPHSNVVFYRYIDYGYGRP
jgi:hypothetical protein